MVARPAAAPFVNLRPSASVICLSSAPGSPVRSGDAITVMVSPGLIMLKRQPARFRILVLAHSTSQCFYSPLFESIPSSSM